MHHEYFLVTRSDGSQVGYNLYPEAGEQYNTNPHNMDLYSALKCKTGQAELQKNLVRVDEHTVYVVFILL